MKLYGSPMSRAARCLWAMEELGLQYELIPTQPFAETHTPEFLKINPNGHIPVLEDQGKIFWESLAINLYLAEKYGQGKLWPSSVEDHGYCYQWSFWAITEVEPHLITLVMNRVFLPSEQRNEQAAKAAEEALNAPSKVINDYLAGREYLGEAFSIGDLNVASVYSFALFAQVDLSPYPHLKAWLDRCLGRPAQQKVMGMMQPH
jgi:glutathione S-transferase